VTQAQIAKELGVRPQAVSNWEKGVSIPAILILKKSTICVLLYIQETYSTFAFKFLI
jgi:transcriptional regulator with XRE-family HTH domain